MACAAIGVKLTALHSDITAVTIVSTHSTQSHTVTMCHMYFISETSSQTSNGDLSTRQGEGEGDKLASEQWWVQFQAGRKQSLLPSLLPHCLAQLARTSHTLVDWGFLESAHIFRFSSGTCGPDQDTARAQTAEQII